MSLAFRVGLCFLLITRKICITVGSAVMMSSSTTVSVVWNKIGEPEMLWNGISTDSSGQRILALSHNGTFLSNDFGATWSLSSHHIASKCVSSSTGQHLTTMQSNGYIHISSDFGTTWTEAVSAGLKKWHDIVSDSTGQRIVAVEGQSSTGGGIHISADYGATWNRVNGMNNVWNSVSASDGTFILTGQTPILLPVLGAVLHFMGLGDLL